MCVCLLVLIRACCYWWKHMSLTRLKTFLSFRGVIFIYSAFDFHALSFHQWKIENNDFPPNFPSLHYPLPFQSVCPSIHKSRYLSLLWFPLSLNPCRPLHWHNLLWLMMSFLVPFFHSSSIFAFIIQLCPFPRLPLSVRSSREGWFI